MLENIPFPKESYTFQSNLEAGQIKRIMEDNLTVGALALTHNNPKKFLGEMSNNTFEIISTVQKTGVFCVIKGRFIPIDQNPVEIDVVFNRTFRTLFMFWFLALTALMVFTSKGTQDFIIHYVMFLLFVFLMRHFLAKVYANLVETVVEEFEDTLQISRR